MNDIAWFKELSNKDVNIAGGKGASLGEMYNAGFPIPPGFCVTAGAYKKFLDRTGIWQKIASLLSNLNEEDTTKLQEVANEIQKIIVHTPMPNDIKQAILESYEALDVDEELMKNQQAMELIKSGKDLPLVAVRSSATAEDLPTASFAGQQATYLNIKGGQNVIIAVQKCWASLFTARAIYYRIKNKFDHEKVLISVVVQKMVNSDKSGVMFSVNPVTNNDKEIMIEAGWGLGEAVVSGAINPDQYIVDKDEEKIISVNVRKQDWMYTLDPNLNKTVKKDLPEEKKEARVLTDFEVLELAKLAKKSEEHYKKPQDMEFAIEKNKIYIVQSRPITTLKKQEEKVEVDKSELKDAKVLVKGISASPGVAQGKVKIVKSPEELGKVEKGDILVATMTNPDYVVAMEKSAAIVTDEGGSTSHAAIVGREMGLPVIVGTENATSVLQDNQEVTVDATSGVVYGGLIKIEDHSNVEEEMSNVDVSTVTEIKVIMDLPDYAEKAAATGADGVGLLRGEFINLGSKVHPSYLIKTGRKDEFINNLFENLVKIASAFKDKPVWYRTLDAPTDEFRQLEGGEDEPEEDNPMLGWRSIRRSLDDVELFKAEFEAIKKAHDAGYTNIGVMIPLVTHVEQVVKAKDILREVGLEPQEEIDFGIMVETPAAVQIIEDLCNVGIDFVSFGTNDLTQFTLALDRNSAKVQKWYDEMHPAVLKEIKHVIKVCRKFGVETSICGQAGSKPEMAEFLVKAGIDSISANPDAVKRIRQVVAKAEKKLLLSVARKDLEF
ncbi:phosphoenolpyruvate synthase [Candidatus Woesearchaeota archaeon]|nr:MAG: phosphoenolpyruvate synthase [Candidatus Woesearchaeota archaeon]